MPPVTPPELIARIRERLHAQLDTDEITLTDNSARHAGHAEAGERHHLTVRIVSARFAGVPRIARHRLVYAALAEELAGPVHALNITALAPEEALPRQEKR